MTFTKASLINAGRCERIALRPRELEGDEVSWSILAAQELLQFLPNPPPDVKAQVLSAFAQVGWDVRIRQLCFRPCLEK